MISVPLNGSEVRILTNPSTRMPLHVIAARGMVFSSWRPSPEEKVLLMSDKPVWVIMRGQQVPEFIVAVGDRNQVVPPEIIKRARKSDELLQSEIGREVIAKHRARERAVTLLTWVYLLSVIGGALAFGFLIWKFFHG